MPKARADKEQQLPLQGLNTEASPLNFPETFAVDMNNMVVDFDPLSLRPRYGLTKSVLTSNKTENVPANENDQAYSAFLWERVNEDPDTHFVCVQFYQSLLFIEINNADSGTLFSQSVPLDDIKSGTVKGTLALASQEPLSYTRVKGKLLITNSAIDPTLVSFDGTDISISKLTLKVRDIWGLESGIEVDKRPSAIGDFPVGVTASATYPQISEEHEYNLLNQGWHQQRKLIGGAGALLDPIAEYFTANSVYPSNAEIVHIGVRPSSTNVIVFDPDWLRQQTFGNSPAPRGRYVVEAFRIDREFFRNNPQLSGANTGGGLDISEGGLPSDELEIPPGVEIP